MKAKLNFKIFFAFFCLTVFASTITAQEEKPRVIEFAQVGVKSNETEIDRLTETLEKFISCLEKEPATTRGFINVPVNTELGKKIKLFMANAAMESRVSFLGEAKYLKYYHFSDINFFLVPKNAGIPRIYTLEPCICPTLNVIAPEIVTNQNSVLTFEAKVGDGDIDGLSYHWQVSAGKIVEGQGTKAIEVDAKGANEITATVTIGGFCETCMKVASFITKIK